MRLFRIIVPLLACLAVLSCRKEEEKDDGYKEKTALIFYGAGYNNLSSDIGENISTMAITRVFSVSVLMVAQRHDVRPRIQQQHQDIADIGNRPFLPEAIGESPFGVGVLPDVFVPSHIRPRFLSGLQDTFDDIYKLLCDIITYLYKHGKPQN